ncbi:MAG: hypothetical protein ACLP4V_30510 [Methylocella sp.]
MLDGLLARPSQFATSTTVEKVGEGLADAIREWEASSAKLAKAT